jgi:glycosyltransferase involved in cell wall biosynthesis
MAKKNVWIFNHYIVPPTVEEGHRHSKFAVHLEKRGYHTVLFFSSYLHRQKLNIINNNNRLLMENCGNSTYVALKTRSYEGNRFKRVLNILDYFRGLLRASKISLRQLAPPDVIIASSVHPLTCVAGIIVARKMKVPCIVEIRDLWPLSLVKLGKLKERSLTVRLMYLLEKWIYMEASSLVFTMEGGKDYVVDSGLAKSLDISKINHVNNGIDLAKYNEESEKFDYDSSELADSNVFKVIYAGSLGEANAPQYIVEAARIIQDKESKVKFFVFGDGTQRKKLEAYCQRYGVSNLHFLGRVDKKYIPNILKKGDLNVITGHDTDLYKYGISLNKLFDYLASGKPTISNMKCGYDLLDKYQCGVTVEAGNAETLADGIMYFYNLDINTYKKYCSNALTAAENYDFAKLTDSLISIINDVCS